jgi:hypothetical protein
MENRIIFTLKDNQGNLRGQSEKAFIEKDKLKLKEKENSTMQVYIGEPDVQIDDIHINLSNNSASNILIACESDNLGVRIISSSIISLISQSPDSKFYSFNFLSNNIELTNYINEFNSIANDTIRDVKLKESISILQLIKVEIENRILNPKSEKLFLSIIGFQSAYNFRKQEYESSVEGKLLEFILKEGSLVGVYCLLMVDSIQSFSKNLSSNYLDEFSWRIVGQIDSQSSASILDSQSSFLGSRDANELGENRALFFDCKKNKLIKFIPYELPNLGWVRQLIINNSKLS